MGDAIRLIEVKEEILADNIRQADDVREGLREKKKKFMRRVKRKGAKTVKDEGR